MTTPFDPLSSDFARDPYAAYAALRAAPGLTYHADTDTWMAARMSDVQSITTHRGMVRVMDDLLTEAERRAAQVKLNWHDMPNHERFVQFSMLDSEGAVHDRLRHVVRTSFTPRMVERQREGVQRFVDGLLAQVDEAAFDFIGDFAAHVPGHIIGNVLGVPDEDCPQLRFWSEEVVRFFDIGRDDDDKARAERATTDFYLYLVDLLKDRRAHPRDDLLSVLIAARDDGQMSEDELISTAMLILMAGHGSTIDVLGSGMHTLLRFPDQMARLRDDLTLMPTAVQEMFRFESPLPFFHRFATEIVEIAGQSFPAGTRFGVLYGAANRDPDAFEAPEQFDVGRTPNRHIAFGKGVHFCLGNHLARLDMDVIFSTLLSRYARIELLEDPDYKRGLAVRGPKTLPIRLHQ